MRTIEWDDGIVKMIDQRKLPQEVVVVEFSDYREVARAIKEMYIRGAPAIGAAAAFGLALGARQSQATNPEQLLGDLAPRLLTSSGPSSGCWTEPVGLNTTRSRKSSMS
jgi:methylthioribose-1-phosphate isomerase